MPDVASSPERLRRFAFFLLALCFVLGVAGRGLQETYPVFLLPLQAEFDWSRASISSIYAISFAVVGFSGPVVGWLYDRFGPFTVYAMGVVAIAVAAFGAGQAESYWRLALCLGLLLGFGSACVGMVPFAALLSRWFRERLNLALAVAQSSYGTGILILAPTAQYLIDWQGWRTAYTILAALLIALLPLLMLVPWRIAAAGHPSYRRQGEGSAQGRGRDGPTLGEALGTETFWAIIWSFVFTGIGMYTVSLQAPAYLVSIGYSPQQAAEAFGAVGLLLPVGVIGFGWLSVRIGRQRAMLMAYSLSIVGILGLVGQSTGPSLPLLGLFVVCFGGTFGSRGPAVLTIAALNFQGAHLGRIYGMLTIGMGGGGAIGAWLGGFLHDLTGGYQVGLWTGIASLFVAALPFLLVRTMARS